MTTRKQTMLERAMSFEPQKRMRGTASSEERELVLAWLKQELSVTQLNVGFGFGTRGGSRGLQRAANVMRVMFQSGELQEAP